MLIRAGVEQPDTIKEWEYRRLLGTGTIVYARIIVYSHYIGYPNFRDFPNIAEYVKKLSEKVS